MKWGMMLMNILTSARQGVSKFSAGRSQHQGSGSQFTSLPEIGSV